LHSISHTSKIFDLVHIDIWGPCFTPSLYGHKYFLTIVVDYSCYTRINLMHKKSKTHLHLVNFIAYVKFSLLLVLKLLNMTMAPSLL